jgi:large subunit ribosomal protein L9
MKVILMREVPALGDAGEVVEAANGYARNYLIPKKLALPASPANMRVYEEERKQRTVRRERAQHSAGALAEALEQESFAVTAQVGEEDRMFGSVTARDIAQLFAEKGYEVDRRRIMLEEPIRALGVYTVPVRLHPEVEAQVRLWVVKE